MVITDITPSDEKGRREIYVDGQPYMTMSGELVLVLDLHVGDALDETRLEELTAQAESVSALQKAYTYLSFSALSRSKLAEKLAKAGYSEAASEITLTRLEELGLIDDEAYGRRLLEVMRRNKHWGSRRTVMELKKRGLSADLIEALTDDGFDDRENIRYILQTKYRKKDLSDRAERQKVTAGLSRLGFGFEDIRSVINELEDEDI